MQRWRHLDEQLQRMVLPPPPPLAPYPLFLKGLLFIVTLRPL